MLDTAHTDIPPVRRHVLSNATRRALEIRVDALSAEQRAAAEEYEGHFARANEIALQMLERQQRLRQLREILLNGRAA